MVLLNNAIGCAFALILVLSFEIWVSDTAVLPQLRLDEIVYLVASILLSALYHYTGLQVCCAAIPPMSPSYVLPVSRWHSLVSLSGFAQRAEWKVSKV